MAEVVCDKRPSPHTAGNFHIDPVSEFPSSLLSSTGSEPECLWNKSRCKRNQMEVLSGVSVSVWKDWLCFLQFLAHCGNPSSKVVAEEVKEYNFYVEKKKAPLCEDENVLLCAGRGGVLAGVWAGGRGWTSPLLYCLGNSIDGREKC